MRTWVMGQEGQVVRWILHIVVAGWGKKGFGVVVVEVVEVGVGRLDG